MGKSKEEVRVDLGICEAVKIDCHAGSPALQVQAKEEKEGRETWLRRLLNNNNNHNVYQDREPL